MVGGAYFAERESHTGIEHGNSNSKWESFEWGHKTSIRLWKMSSFNNDERKPMYSRVLNRAVTILKLFFF